MSSTIKLKQYTRSGLPAGYAEFDEPHFIAACTRELLADDPTLPTLQAMRQAQDRFKLLRAEALRETRREAAIAAQARADSELQLNAAIAYFEAHMSEGTQAAYQAGVEALALSKAAQQLLEKTAATKPETAAEKAERARKNKRPAEMTDQEFVHETVEELKKENPGWSMTKLLSEARKSMLQTQKERARERGQVEPPAAGAKADPDEDEFFRQKVRELQAGDPKLKTADALDQARQAVKVRRAQKGGGK